MIRHERVRPPRAVFADETRQSLLSRSAVSAVTERLWAEYEAFGRGEPAVCGTGGRIASGIGSGCIPRCSWTRAGQPSEVDALLQAPNSM